MREIKFRAWNAYHRRMEYPERGEDMTDKITSASLLASYNDGGLEAIMQYTGLKDKNGKDVYEGDIVKCQQGCSHQVIYVYDIGGEFWGGMPGFALEGLLRNGGKGYAWTGEEEVIGNIYENPDLIK